MARSSYWRITSVKLINKSTNGQQHKCTATWEISVFLPSLLWLPHSDNSHFSVSSPNFLLPVLMIWFHISCGYLCNAQWERKWAKRCGIIEATLMYCTLESVSPTFFFFLFTYSWDGFYPSAAKTFHSKSEVSHGENECFCSVLEANSAIRNVAKHIKSHATLRLQHLFDYQRVHK